MPMIKCKMCGGDLNLIEGSTVCECEYCGTKQTVPSADNEKKLTLFSRAGRLLRACEFDKAAGVFETIVADFPQEAEAYWGLVLCKYGIEYVDDPATGKKIPTCHRSSFESVLDDANFEQACENTDAVARRVYRDEARQIEALRQAILQVSGQEEPYDVFISYKETDEHGERTLDSVIAQDIYKELTNEGYRVFFSRISLEDKLGTEYEPYIFAALNSAKVMLVVGTDYENFDAVWVKNEWSRFLKLIAKGEKKTLIPVFKNMDAYDMPKEFAKLAAQDMGKMGAMQDLVRGVEKIVSKKKAEPAQPQPVQQPVYVSGGPNVTAMIERGHQALEDSEWAKADEFFDQALNMDAKCAEAFLGKFLAQEKAVSLDAALDNRLAECDRSVTTDQKKIEANTSRVNKLAEKYAIHGYLERPAIESKLNYDLSYPSTVASREAIQRRVLEQLSNDKLFSRVKRYASKDLSETITAAEQRFEQSLAMRTRKAREEEAENRLRKQTMYNDYLAKAEKNILDLHEHRAANQERDYQEACKLKAEASTIPEYEQVIKKLTSPGLEEYKDSVELIADCKNRISDLTEQERQRKEAAAKAAAEKAERERIEREKAEAARKKKQRKIAVMIASLAMIAIAAFFTATKVVFPAIRYQQALGALNRDDIIGAYEGFAALGNYRDSATRRESIKPEYHSLSLKAAQAGANVFFGSYEQDNDLSNGKEDIEWLVLAKEDSRILVISKYALDCHQYHAQRAETTWETCTLRTWLNGRFLNDAFTKEDQTRIPTVPVYARRNQSSGLDAGKNTEDKVFLLDIAEAEKYFTSNEARICNPTAYAIEKGCYIHGNAGTCRWWLRSPGFGASYAAVTLADGSVLKKGESVAGSIYAVRPAMWIDIGEP